MTTYFRTYLDGSLYEHRYVQHVHSDDELVECIYCGELVPGCADCPAPPADDEGRWSELSPHHSDNCEWVVTRAHGLID